MNLELVVGTRGSALALAQTGMVVDSLKSLHPGLTVRVEIIKTEGDIVDKPPLWQIGGQGVFVKELEAALLDGRIDFAVHSMKDLPSSVPQGLVLAAVPEREDPRDVAISRHGMNLADLPRGARVGTSSARRRGQLLAFRPDFEIVPLRGNVDTRLRKSEEGDLDAIILAAAGLSRLGYLGRVTEYLDPEICLPAVGQGALAIQAREGDRAVEILRVLDHQPTHSATMAERAFLAEMGGGCQLPMAALCRHNGASLVMDVLAASPDGSEILRARDSASAADTLDLGKRLGQKLKANGAERLMGGGEPNGR